MNMEVNEFARVLSWAMCDKDLRSDSENFWTDGLDFVEWFTDGDRLKIMRIGVFPPGRNLIINEYSPEGVESLLHQTFIPKGHEDTYFTSNKEYFLSLLHSSES